MKPIDHKQALVAQAALHRRRMTQASHVLADSLHPGALVKGAGGLALAGLAFLRNGKGGGVSGGVAGLLPLALPVAMRGLSLLSRLKPSRSATRKLLAVGVLGAVAAFALKRAGAKRSGKSEERKSRLSRARA